MEKKKEVLDIIDKGVSQRTIAVRFGVVKSTLGNIIQKQGCNTEGWGRKL
jgi:DNA invertase Pin-like site-specific DNA recombinase